MAQITFSFDFASVGTVDFIIRRKDQTAVIPNPETGAKVISYKKKGIQKGDPSISIDLPSGDYELAYVLVTNDDFTPSATGNATTDPVMVKVNGSQNLDYTLTV